MSQSQKQKRKEQKALVSRARYNEIKRKGIEVNLLKTVQILQTLITESMCQVVFKNTRNKERQRDWSLYLLVQFWNAVIIQAPQALRQALGEAQGGRDPRWPRIESTAEGFFKRSQNLHYRFFANLFEAFEAQLAKIAPPCFAQEELKHVFKRFTHIWAVDGSTLDAIAHRLKLLRHEVNVVLPGAILACYDLMRGYARLIHFSEHAFEGELKRLAQKVGKIPAGTLLLADRLYAAGKLFKELTEKDLHGLFRRHRNLSIRKVKRLSRQFVDGGVLEDWWVDAGVERQRLRWMVFRSREHNECLELLTNVLDPKRLSAKEAMELYPYRWNIERLFYDLKEVLNLHRFYAGNRNAVAMQVYSAVMVHAALRVAQGRIARQTGIRAESISVAKFFPRMAAASCRWSEVNFAAQMVRNANRGIRLKEPKWSSLRVFHVKLYQIMVEPRIGPKADTRVAYKKRNWKSLYDIMLHTQN